jgi:hypothetical protein
MRMEAYKIMGNKGWSGTPDVRIVYKDPDRALYDILVTARETLA